MVKPVEDKVLILTVGTGDMEKLEDTLLKPLEKSLKEGDWNKVILLPSTVTEANASKFKDRMAGFPIEIKPLEQQGLENDADACFHHFNKILEDLAQAGFEPRAITPDFTRGTKAMSAALVLAAVRHDIPTLRYIHGKRDRRGMVSPGTEEISEVDTALATTRRKLDDAKRLMSEGAFAAVLELLPDVDAAKTSPFALLRELKPSKEFDDKISRLRRLAAFWSAWDRLDYREACECAGELRQGDREALESAITRVGILANQPEQNEHARMADWLRHVTADLLDNGYRRINQHQFEDALLRAYRVLELIGQFRLFDRGHDSARIDPECPDVIRFRNHLKKKKSEDFGTRNENSRQVLTASKFLAARFLKHLRDPFGEKLLDFENEQDKVKASARNRSILIHGFSVAENFDEVSLRELYGRIKRLLEEDRPGGPGPDRSGFGIVPRCPRST
ncbi:MAG: TIGR02710 family CRISPR-associated protein [Hyphomonadaceae bacterium]|nr:TIGR02710 family CRISPR-associated protein [Hyphomonadaceae bacterium]MBC6412345.1 TIGR02710 family CRISPR-associated protein [Hyphomonadaceae bacterium]